MSRNSVAVYDAALAREQAQAEVRRAPLQPSPERSLTPLPRFNASGGQLRVALQWEKEAVHLIGNPLVQIQKWVEQRLHYLVNLVS